MIKMALMILALTVLTIPQSLAKPRYNYHPGPYRDFVGFSSYSSWHQAHFRASYRSKARKGKLRAKKPRLAIHRKSAIRQARISPVILPHPEGCPRTRFCGCGASLKVFGERIRSLYLARNWFKFPASDPGPGKVAVRVGHVFVILKDLGKRKVLAYDANSGGHKTRIHVRSLAGYSVRDPKGKTQLAMR